MIPPSPTASPEARIAQFEKMAAADPDNDMAHFSLGNAYLRAAAPPRPPAASSGASRSTAR
jgi:hypothetical protein